jgi:hypothetical protein
LNGFRKNASASVFRSEPGLALMHARVRHGYNEWIPSARRQHRYIIQKMAPNVLGKVIEELMLERPRK